MLKILQALAPEIKTPKTLQLHYQEGPATTSPPAILIYYNTTEGLLTHTLGSIRLTENNQILISSNHSTIPYQSYFIHLELAHPNLIPQIEQILQRLADPKKTRLANPT